MFLLKLAIFHMQWFLIAGLIFCHQVQAQTAVDPRDPARLSEEFLQTQLDLLAEEQALVRGEVSAVWDEEINAAASEAEAAALTEAKDVGLANLDQIAANDRKVLEKQLLIARANGGTAFGVVVPFFGTLESVSDTRPAGVPVAVDVDGNFYKPIRSNGRRGKPIVKNPQGEFNVSLVFAGVDPNTVSSVAFEFVNENPPMDSTTLTHLPFLPPTLLENATSDREIQGAGDTDPDTVELNIVTEAYTLRSIIETSEGTIVAEGLIAIRNLAGVPPALTGTEPPLDPNIENFVADQELAIALGKALFWDVQVSSDNQTACATCHNDAGVDLRTNNQFSLDLVNGHFRGPGQASIDTFPLPVGEVFGSQGVENNDFGGVSPLASPPSAELEADLALAPSAATPFDPNRQVTKRNSPTVINAAFYDRQFWDGRAARFFNGANIHGELDPEAFVYRAETTANGKGKVKTSISRVNVLLDTASLASQAVGPVISSVEMSWRGREFHHLGQKLFRSSPLVFQNVDPTDSVLGTLPIGNGQTAITYADLIQQAFHEEWWNTSETVRIGRERVELMDANASLFIGLAIMLYERTLVSDQTRFDEWALGDANALTPEEIEGMELFHTIGKCNACHIGPLFTSATHDNAFQAIELMPMKNLVDLAHYDEGFYNVGASPQENDIGQGATTPFGVPLSYTRQAGLTPDAVDGAFKTPTLRNVELTGPYLHNGRYATLDDTVDFYLRGGDHDNLNLHPEIGVILLPPGERSRNAMSAFMKTLTDERVRFKRAPFDHPSLPLPDGSVIEAVGAAGSATPVTGFLGQAAP